MALNKYNNLLTSGIWSTKYPKDDNIMALVGVDWKLADDSKKSYDKSNRYPTKGEPAYIRDLPPCMLEHTKVGVGKKTKYGKEYWWRKEHCACKGRWVLHKIEDHRKRTSILSISGGSTKPPI